MCTKSKIPLVTQGQSEPYYTLPQAAKHLNIPVSTLRRAASSGLIPTHKPFGERIRVRLPEIEAAIHVAEKGGVA